MDKRIKKNTNFGRVSLLIGTLLLIYGLGTGLAKDSVQSEANEHYLKNYKFSTDWFTRYSPNWMKALGHTKGKPNIHYLEVGVFEGRSAIWMLENILTSPTSKMTCIDIFPDDLQEKFLANLKLSGFMEKTIVIKGWSQIELRKLPINSFDIIYIDASHEAKDVLTDAVLSWELLKTGGILIFDDYLYKQPYPKKKPKMAIDTFVSCFSDYIEVIHSGYQFMLRKAPKRTSNK